MSTPETAEEQLSELFLTFATKSRWELRHPIATLRAAWLLRRIPPLVYRASGSPDSRTMLKRMDRSTFGIRTVRDQAVTVREVGEVGDPGLANKSARKHGRRAERAGVTWRPVAAEDRERFRELAEEHTRFGHDDQYQPDDLNFSSLLSSDLWLAAWQDDKPLLLSVTAVDGDWAMMRYFCSFDDTRTGASTRYLMTLALHDELAKRGVRYVCDSVSPFRLNPGLRQFSRMVGFRNARVRVVREAPLQLAQQGAVGGGVHRGEELGETHTPRQVQTALP